MIAARDVCVHGRQSQVPAGYSRDVTGQLVPEGEESSFKYGIVSGPPEE
jgi:hypothetical protein